MTPQEILKKVRKIDIKTKHKTQQLFAGAYHSAYKGKGMSFSEVREYQFGDDVRNIDWNVTARTNTPYVKIFEEERELNVIVMLDVSASSYFGLTHQVKMETMIEVAAIIAAAATNQKDKVGLLLFSEQIEKYIAPSKGHHHMLKLVTEMVMHRPLYKGSNIAVALQYLFKIEKKRSVVFIVSDFMTYNYRTELDIISRKHDVTAIKVYDLIERDMPACGILKLEDIETGATRWVDTDNFAVRKAYRDKFDEFHTYFLDVFNGSKSGQIEIHTKQDASRILQKYFDKKSNRR
jgi:uncharacterized protein (DUF58 family)